MNGKAILNELIPYQQGKQTEQIKEEFNLNRVVKLSSNENPYGYSNNLRDKLMTIDQALNIYPDGYAAELRTTLATKLNVSETQLVFGNGSDEIVQIISRAYLYPGVNTIMASPTFPQYKHAAMIEGAEIKEIPTVDGYHDLDGMLQAIDERTNVVWICSPDNPTGTLLPKESFYDFMKKCPRDVLVVLDEAYYEFIDKQVELDALVNLPQYKNLILLRTFSKAYGLAGLRIGYGISSENIATKLNIVRGPFNTLSISQQAALIALNDEVFIQDTVLKNNSIKQSFAAFLDAIGWHYYESQTNFLLVSTPISGTEVFKYLIKNGYIIRPGEVLGYPNTVRITIGTEEDMAQLQQLIKKLHLKTSNEG